MVLMNAGKKARNAASITNNTKIFGTMGGLRPNVGKDASVSDDRANLELWLLKVLLPNHR